MRALPALVAVHCEIAPDQCADADIFGKRLKEGRERGAGALRQHIAPVGEGMDNDVGAGGMQTLNHCHHLVLVRMHAAAGHQAHHMNPPAAASHPAAKRGKLGV